ncbi:MAG TPA: RuBisCO large subunit C-terminal-like domain-containing protein [Methanocorpusculum sp.]|jgi:ribulose-bisphosphate carboxylase large chain|nr:RuBisCO large subunit C-terminal-like domain-containing protein [Methanocorpusculum sp.]HJJ62396.1 RuBisCO large subunit C-terminal-like domain-containing protein [Methanocorpusculum sp.]HJJ68804.1 RuBisCO large subunit C-terminal-like domain-containing protein [Methanocorpusculum sp.]HJJ72817.1 RuBisCO large subunit C-terminal-like domain-containing protein [Methanocorpusculum sp.]HJJ82520.1 RuBisCO large subunit C-terminal-like domain-containing protein [Methanocorpusculum sp.]
MKDLIATYYFRTKDGVDASYAANAIREEQTTGTWTSLSTVNDKTAYVHDLDGSVEDLVELPDGGYLTRICFPHEIFEKGNIPQYLSVIAGNLFGLGKLEAVRLLDIDLPEKLCGCGPKFGIEGVRKIVGTEVSCRPHIGTIIKPKVGLNPKDTAQVAYEAALGGLDLIKDDETLTNQTFCPLFERLEAVMDALDRAKDETGKQVLYAVNVTTGGDRIVELAHKAVSAGANMLMVDVLTAGFSAIQALAEDPAINVPIHVHRTMHGALTRNPHHGIAMRPIAKLVRSAGGDQLHTGSVSGKMGSKAGEVLADNIEITKPLSYLKPIFPVSSGGLHPGKVAAEISKLGTDIILQAGGGIHGHPDGTTAGTRAMLQAVEAAVLGIPAREYSLSHPELAAALAKWGDK